MPDVFVSAAFNDMRARDVRFLQEAARLGDVTVLLWSDEAFMEWAGRRPEFPQAERIYTLAALRWVSRVELVDGPLQTDRLPLQPARPGLWAIPEAEDSPAKRLFCASNGLACHILPEAQLKGFPLPAGVRTASDGRRTSVEDVDNKKDLRSDQPLRTVQGCAPSYIPLKKKVIVTGCYDWLHSGHIRFFEQAAAYGDLYVSLGNDANIAQLKGPGHPLLPQDERTYMVASIRFVERAFVAAGFGMLDAAAEIEALRPDIYLVNADGDRPEKRTFCAARGIEYIVLQRLPKNGLPPRQSTHLRGF